MEMCTGARLRIHRLNMHPMLALVEDKRHVITPCLYLPLQLNMNNMFRNRTLMLVVTNDTVQDGEVVTHCCDV